MNLLKINLLKIMFKKIFIITIFFLATFSFYRASAFLDKTVAGTYANNVSYSGLHVVAAGDFADTIYFQATSSPNTTLNILGDFTGNYNYQPLNSVITDETGFAYTFNNYT